MDYWLKNYWNIYGIPKRKGVFRKEKKTKRTLKGKKGISSLDLHSCYLMHSQLCSLPRKNLFLAQPNEQKICPVHREVDLHIIQNHLGSPGSPAQPRLSSDFHGAYFPGLQDSKSCFCCSQFSGVGGRLLTRTLQRRHLRPSNWIFWEYLEIFWYSYRHSRFTHTCFENWRHSAGKMRGR